MVLVWVLNRYASLPKGIITKTSVKISCGTRVHTWCRVMFAHRVLLTTSCVLHPKGHCCMDNRFISPNSCLERCSFIMHPLGLMEKKSPFTHPRLEAAFFLPSVSCDKTAWTWAPQWPWGPCFLLALSSLLTVRNQRSAIFRLGSATEDKKFPQVFLADFRKKQRKGNKGED